MTAKIFLICFLVFVIGGLGGILADQFFLPLLSVIKPFSQLEFIKHGSNGTTIINPTERIIITENVALGEAIEKIKPCLAVIQTYQGQKIINEATGFILTSDGLIITSDQVIFPEATEYLIHYEDISLSANLIKKDTINNLALFKVEKNNLPVAPLVNLEDMYLAQRVLLVGAETGEGSQLNYFVNLGIVRSINQGIVKLNLDEYNLLADGSPLINIRGEVVGLNIIGQKGLLKTVPADEIREFIQL